MTKRDVSNKIANDGAGVLIAKTLAPVAIIAVALLFIPFLMTLDFAAGTLRSSMTNLSWIMIPVIGAAAYGAYRLIEISDATVFTEIARAIVLTVSVPLALVFLIGAFGNITSLVYVAVLVLINLPTILVKLVN